MAYRRHRFVQLRKAAGYTQERFAELLGVERSTVVRWECAETQPQPWLWPKISQALGVSREEFTDILDQVVASPRRRASPPAQVPSRTPGTELPLTLDGLRAALTSYRPFGARAVAGGQPLAAVEARTVALHNAYQQAEYRRLANMLPQLLGEVEDVVANTPEKQRRRAFRAQASAYVLASKLASKAGDGELAWLTADRAAVAARSAEAPELAAVAAYQVGCAFMKASDKCAEAETLVVTTAEDLGRADDRDLDLLSIRGALLLLAVLIAARRGRPQDAKRYLAGAALLAGRLGRDGNRMWTAFGPTNVLIHEISAAVALGQLDKADTIGSTLDTSRLPATLIGRRTQVHLDLATACARRPSGDPNAVLHLLEAERLAPEVFQVNAAARALLTELISRERRHVTPGLRPLAARAGVVR